MSEPCGTCGGPVEKMMWAVEAPGFRAYKLVCDSCRALHVLAGDPLHTIGENAAPCPTCDGIGVPF